MAMSASPSADGDLIMEMNTTPLIDVLLVLLIMLIVTLPIMTHSTVLTMPTGGTAQAQPVNVVIDFDNTILWNGNVVRDLEQFEQFVRHEAKGVAPQIEVRPDRRASYDLVVKVLAITQRNGVNRIAIAGTQ